MAFLGDLLGRVKSEPAIDYVNFYSQVEGQPVFAVPDAQYVRIWLRAARVTDVRRWTSKFVATVHARFTYVDRNQGEREVVSVVAPDKSFQALDPAHLDRLIVVNQPLLGPIPYRGELSMEVALFSVAAVDLAKPYLELLAELTNAASVAFLSQVKPFVEPIRRGAELIFQGNGAQLEIGLARTDTELRTGNIVVARMPKGVLSPSSVRLDPNDFRLLDREGRSVTGVPYLVLGVEATAARSDYAKIPDIRDGWNAVRDVASADRPPEEVRQRFDQLRRAVWLSADLVQADKRRIVEIFSREISDAGYDTAAPREVAALEGLPGVRPLRDTELLLRPEAVQPPTGALEAMAGEPGHGPEAMRSDEPASPNAGDDADVGVAERAPLWELGALEAAGAWRVANALEQLRQQINARFPTRNRKSDGTIGDAAHATRNSDHNPWVQAGSMGIVTAIDVTHDVASGCTGDWLVEALRNSRDPRIKYIIWNRRICSSTVIGGVAAWEWRQYTGKNPHDHHVHLSVRPEPAAYDSQQPWRL